MIPLDNYTRWNSWYLSLVVAEEHGLSIDTYTKSHTHWDELSEDYLILEDWNKLRKIKSFLKPFH
jgi:hypothetical protein